MKKEEEQINFWLAKFTDLSNSFFVQSEYKYHEYWKGQVMGICKIVDLMKIQNVDTKHYLSQLI